MIPITLLIGMLLCITPLWGQDDLQIIVTGPWSYYTQDKKTLYLIAPGNSSHEFYLYEGGDVSRWDQPQPNGAQMRSAGIYAISFDSTYQKGTRPATGRGAPPLELSNVSTLGTPPSNIKSVIADKTNYIVTLPYPDKFSTFEDPTDRWNGFSESRAEPVGSAQAVTVSTPAVLYTTTMVLHYWAKNGIPSQLNLSINSGNPVPIGTSFPATNPPEGITIVSAGIELAASWPCDDMSLESVDERNALFGITQHVLFPEVVDTNGDQSHRYHSSCTQSKLWTNRRMQQSKPLADNGTFHSTAASSADCHASQLSIGGAVPNPTP
jgi:hypothetical protein